MFVDSCVQPIASKDMSYVVADRPFHFFNNKILKHQ